MLADRTTPLYKLANFIGGLAAPMFLFLAGVSVAMAASSRTRRSGDRAAASWSVQKRGWQILGRSSLFVYWIHVELAYGVFSYPLHRKLPVWWSLIAFTAFTVFIYGVTRLKSRFVAGWNARRAAPQPA